MIMAIALVCMYSVFKQTMINIHTALVHPKHRRDHDLRDSSLKHLVTRCYTTTLSLFANNYKCTVKTGDKAVTMATIQIKGKLISDVTSSMYT